MTPRSQPYVPGDRLNMLAGLRAALGGNSVIEQQPPPLLLKRR
ncbi:MAG: hypothetical protein QOI16_2878 [Pseudonocardiales bacterium]|nr:hypothetical protein [Pseudonocardiales bacterium]